MWQHAARVAIDTLTDTAGVTLPRGLLARLPDHRDALLATWRPYMSVRQRERIVGASSEGEPSAPTAARGPAFVLGVLGALAGARVSPARVRRLARWSLLRGELGPLFPALMHAEMSSHRPGSLLDDPRGLAAPEGLPPGLVDQWTTITDRAAALIERLGREIDAAVNALPKLRAPKESSPQGGETLDVAGVELPAGDDDDHAALIDEAVTTARRALVTHDTTALIAEGEVWARAVMVAVERDTEGVGLALPRLLLSLQPERRDALFASWRLTAAQRARIESSV